MQKPFHMETALTNKEAEEAKRYQPKDTKKGLKPVSMIFGKMK
ncbi:MAG: hypothetical protein CM1200mP16_11060 [Nitrospina sp.]|nr:MAG: hypothetical protein CM1200mP16_11060 [Nitrospina sp.]